MAIQNPWHDISIGKKAPSVVETVIEVPKGSMNKYELDKDTGMIRLDRVLFSAVHYPGDYGFVPQTLCDDGDPLDVVVLTSNPLVPLALASVRVLGVMKIVDGGEQDDKLIGVYDEDPRNADWKKIEDVPKHLIAEIKEFFETYKNLQKKKCQVTGVHSVSEAHKVIQDSQKLYAQKYPKKH